MRSARGCTRNDPSASQWSFRAPLNSPDARLAKRKWKPTTDRPGGRCPLPGESQGIPTGVLGKMRNLSQASAQPENPSMTNAAGRLSLLPPAHSGVTRPEDRYRFGAPASKAAASTCKGEQAGSDGNRTAGAYEAHQKKGHGEALGSQQVERQRQEKRGGSRHLDQCCRTTG